MNRDLIDSAALTESVLQDARKAATALAIQELEESTESLRHLETSSSASEADPLSALHPIFVAIQRDVALTDHKLHALERSALSCAPLVANGEVTRGDCASALVAVADNNGLCKSARERTDVEHVVGQGIAGIASLPPLPDASTRVARHGSRQHEGAKLLIRCAADIQPEKIKWLWRDRIAIGKLTLVAGEPGLGKSQLTAALAGTVTSGAQWPNDEGSAPLGSVVILSAEDDAADTIVPRLIAAGASTARVHIISAVVEPDGVGRRVFNLQGDLALLEAMISRIEDVRLVVIDPISSYLGRTDSHKNSELRATLEPIGDLASRLGVAFVAVTHLNKNNGASANQRVTGSIAFVAAARACYIVSRDPDDDERRLFLPSKNNIGPDRVGLAFRIGQRDIGDGVIAPSIYWDPAPVTRTADEILSVISGDGSRHTAKSDGVTFLEDILAHGPLATADIEREAIAAGLLVEGQPISQCKPLRSARDALGIKPYREGGTGAAGRWLWALPGQAT